jgi:hypothetical protein
MPTLANLLPLQDGDVTLEGQHRFMDSVGACLIAPALGPSSLQLPVGYHGALRTGV